MSKLAPGRENEARQGNRKELGATIVLKISLAETSAKVRVGPPQDDEEDMAIQVWAGVLPMHVVNGAPVPAALSAQDAPAYVRNWAG
jgi:hypothetical protein